MKFKSESERQDHFLGRLIPKSIFNSTEFFCSELSDVQMALMQIAKESDLLEYIKHHPFSNKSIDDLKPRYSAWLAIVYSHPGLSPDFLKTLAKKLKLEPNDQFLMACTWGNLEYFKSLFTHSKRNQAHDCGFFTYVCEHANVDVFDYWIGKLSPLSIKGMISAFDYAPFLKAAANGHIEILNRLEKLASPHEFQLMIAAGSYRPFYEAVKNNQRAVLDYIEEKAPDKIPEMILRRECKAYRTAAKLNQRDLFLHFESRVTPRDRVYMIAENHYEALNWMAMDGHEDRINHWLKDKTVFNYVEECTTKKSQQYFTPFIASFITKLLEDLHEEKAEFEARHPSAEKFDVSIEDASYLYIALRNLIRRNDRTLFNEIDFLLGIPKVKEFVAKLACQKERSNELLVLAHYSGNEFAVSRLNDIPQVKELGIYYRRKMPFSIWNISDNIPGPDVGSFFRPKPALVKAQTGDRDVSHEDASMHRI